MVRQLLKESLIVFGGTLFFLLLCATVGISMSTPPTSPTAEADEQVYSSEDLSVEQSPFSYQDADDKERGFQVF